ncbi:hypothetical protein TI39_contig636g00001 [Zymoseptoria brevis]|uniref:Zn(2)-C6 fungal-type domain-containing protein n=1 Tax=Zymoseptoria brevis TaxID=1047168 RepID=A0A0F4GG10_9PEZI|nr:hypothetical protein TI39_contig636g00001 [Zymoseptoria brevis]
MTDALQLQACQRCRARKVRCSKEAPQCQTCKKAQAECVFLGSPTGERYTRQEIAELESREAELRAAIIDSPSDAATRRPRTISQAPAVSSHAADGTPDRQDLDIIFSSPQFQSDLLKRLLARENIQQPDVGPAELPSMDLADMNESHVQKPFLLTEYVGNLVQEIYSHTPPEGNDAQDLFRLYMICAISAVPLQRRGLEQQHPYSFFLAASAYFDKVNSSSGVEALQNLFLLARFAVYFHIGASTWELGRICIGICVEQEMHLPPLFDIPPLEEPYAILDDDIEVKLPVNMSDHDLAILEPGGLDHVPQGLENSRSPMAVFVYFIRLRRITSRVQRAFFASPKAKSSVSQDSPVQHATESPEVHDKLQKLLDELEEWRRDAPMFTDMTAFYQAHAWHGFLWEKERLLLLRGAMNDISAPARCRTLLTAGLLVACLSSRSRTTGPLDDGTNASGTTSEEVKATLLTCSQLLQSLSAEEMTDARPYATVFELICEMTCSDWKAYKQAAVSSIDEMDALDLSMATNLPDWSYSPGYLFAGVEAYVNQFATGDFATDPMLDPVSWMRGV